VTVSPSSIATVQALGTPTFALGAVTISPAGIPSSETFGTPILSGGVLTIQITAWDDGESFRHMSVTIGSVLVVQIGPGAGGGFFYLHRAAHFISLEPFEEPEDVCRPVIVIGRPVKLVICGGFVDRETKFSKPSIFIGDGDEEEIIAILMAVGF
jgi:hypothetical protein